MMLGCDSCTRRADCTTKRLVKAVEMECGVDLTINSCEYADRMYDQPSLPLMSSLPLTIWDGIRMWDGTHPFEAGVDDGSE
jgi:hypothetical protein